MKECLLYTNFQKDGPSFADVNCNSIEITDRPLVVNCANCTNTNGWSINYNRTGRLDYYFLYLISSDFIIETPDGTETLHEGEVVVIPAKKSYRMTPIKGKTIYYLCVHFTGYDAENMLKEYEIELFPKINKLSPNNNLQARFKRLFEAFAINDKYRDKELANLTERIFIETARAIKARKHEKTPLLSKSIGYINEYYTGFIKIPYLAKMENMSMTSYNREFKRQMQMTPTKYIIGLRMHLAKELLETTSLSIKEISTMCGYLDYNFFSRAFKENIGLFPSAYKQKINAD